MLLEAQPDTRAELSAFYSFIGCPLDMRSAKEKSGGGGGKTWWHGAVWHYDFVLGANGKSFGLDLNILILCLIVYGAPPDDPTSVAANINAIVDDIPGPAAPRAAAAGTLLVALLLPALIHFTDI